MITHPRSSPARAYPLALSPLKTDLFFEAHALREAIEHGLSALGKMTLLPSIRIDHDIRFTQDGCEMFTVRNDLEVSLRIDVFNPVGVIQHDLPAEAVYGRQVTRHGSPSLIRPFCWPLSGAAQSCQPRGTYTVSLTLNGQTATTTFPVV